MKFIAPAFLTLLLTACSGGGDKDTGTTLPPTDQTGDADTDTDTDTDPTDSGTTDGTGS